MPKIGIIIERGNAKESYERAQVLQPVLDWGSSETPASPGVERKYSPELLCRLVADRMHYSSLNLSMRVTMCCLQCLIPSSRTIRNHISW